MSDNEPAASTDATVVSPTREALRAELEETRTKYHELLDSLSEEDWKQKSGNPAWNVRQLMWHMAWAGGYTPQGVESCRKGKGMNPPNWIADRVNTLMTRFGSRSATRESVGAKYDAEHAKAIASLDSVQDDEWQKSARVFNREMTIESTYRDLIEHFREHETDIKEGLGRG